MNSEKWTKSSIATSVLCVGLVAGATYALLRSQCAQLTAERHLGLDIEVGTAMAKLVSAENQQYAAAQAVFFLSEQTGAQNTQRLTDAKDKFNHETERIESRSREVAELAYGASQEHEGYESFVENVSQAAADKLEFAENLRTVLRLSGEGRTAEATRFAKDVESKGERIRLGMLTVLGNFQAGSLRRGAEHQASAWRAAWAGIFCAIATCLIMTTFFRLKLRQARRDFARRLKDVAPQAEHLKVARARTGATGDINPADHGEQPLAGCRVLAAEDGPHNQRFINRVLTTAGADVVIAENGDDAVELAFTAHKQGNPFDVVLMDMQMPVMDGMEATQTLRRFHYQSPIVAVSANSHGKNREQCLEAGCDGYLAKPISQDELLAVVGNFYEPTAEVAAELGTLNTAD